jgi:hypothetical protein
MRRSSTVPIATLILGLAASAFAMQDRAAAQGAAPNLSGTYRCVPEPSSCQWSGNTFTIVQNGKTLDMKNDKGDVAQGLVSSNITLSVGAPWNMLGVIEPDHAIQWSNGTLWRKQ